MPREAAQVSSETFGLNHTFDRRFIESPTRACAPRSQVLFANGVAVAWNTYISYATHSSQPLEPSPKADNRKLERGGRGRREDDKSVSTA
eukprot:scaffold176832_cov35-Tisochrysis_lutea.AAC.4